MGKRGKAKRNRENEVNTAALVSKLLKRSADVANDGYDSSDADDITVETTATGQHGISDAALETTVATLHVLCGLVDPVTGKSALKDKRYRSLRRVLYELQTTSSGGPQTSSTTTLSSLSGSNNNSQSTDNAPLLSISSSKMTREISAQIDNGCLELAVTTLRNVRKRQEEYSNHHPTNNNTTSKKSTNGKEKEYLRPKLGAVQRWIRQIDAAGTNDPLALQVIDAILRVVAPEAILPVGKEEKEKATWARLGVSNDDVNGKGIEGGSIRLFPPFDRRLEGDLDGDDIASKPQSTDGVHALVACMDVGEDGIRRISIPQLNVHRDTLFRKCGYEKGANRKPPNNYDLELLTTAHIAETKSLESTATSKINTYSGEHILLLDNTKTVVKTPLPYVQDSFLLENVLSPTECHRLIAAAETAGYTPDEPLAGQPGASILAHACVWVVDHALERMIFERVKEFLPCYEEPSRRRKDDLGDGETTFRPLGLNRRFRFYRYVPGRYYRPHVDGAWPKSGFDRKGKYRYDVCDEENKNGLQFVEKGEESSPVEPVKKDDNPKQQPTNENGKEASPGVTNRRQLSRLTFLIYLNDDFDGGHTTFLVPAEEKEGILNAFPVTPLRGGVLVFPHGTCAAPLHEGSPVLKRCKYVVRTEVEYYL